MTADLAADIPTAVYRLFDADGVLLYVGMTNDLSRRMADHARDREWWPKVHRKTAAWYPSRERAAVAELIAIEKEAPLHNGTRFWEAEQVPFGVPGRVRSPSQKRRERLPHCTGERPGYRQIAAILTSRVNGGDYPLGSRLPSRRDLALEFGVATLTMERALGLLADDGLIRASRGSGTQVVNVLPATPLTELERIDRLEADMAAVKKRLGMG